MESLEKLNNKLLFLCLTLFIWFFASNLYTAFTKAPEHDDAMFTTVAKNIVAGYGWATSYGEKIPFNPDLTAGPSLLLPAAGMIVLFGAQTWTPAVTGTLLNIALTLLILWQLNQLVKNRVAHFFALLISMTIYAVHDFRTFTGYYASSQLFILSLLIILNVRYSSTHRIFIFGLLAAIGYLAKPLILLSFIITFPFVLYFLVLQDSVLSKKLFFLKHLLYFLAAFLIIFSPWLVYKNHQLSKYDDSFRAAHTEYSDFFFEHHGTGIAQLKHSKDVALYVYRNSAKNYRILRNFLKREYNFPIYLVAVFIFSTIFFTVYSIKHKSLDSVEKQFIGILSLVILFHYLWYVIISFAMTPGHAYFPTRYIFFLLFFCLATIPKNHVLAIALCLCVSTLFPVRQTPLLEAFKFNSKDSQITNLDIDEALDFLFSHQFQYPLASCGYHAGPWRLEMLSKKSHVFLDCFNLLEDALLIKQGKYLWNGNPSFTLVMEGYGLLYGGKDRAYVLNPIFSSCLQHMLFRNDFYAFCEVPFTEIKDQLDPNKTAQELNEYQSWYRTRLKLN